MTLLSTARALDDAQFRWRVMGACLVHAANFASISEANGKFYAISTILNPQIVNASMVAFVAMDSIVSAAIVSAADGSVNSSSVTDEDIQRVVSAKWSLVGTKYKVNPLL